MSRLNIAPTKSNQLSLRRDLRMATEGFALLDQKREILVLELMRLLTRIHEVRQRLERAQTEAHDTLRRAVTHNGYHRMRRIGAGIDYEHRVRIERHVIAGVRVPSIQVEQGALGARFGFGNTDSLVDQTMLDFLGLLAVVSEMAELETAAWILARELKKTQRRVNALEQIFIPDYRDTLKAIGDALEGKELEAFYIMKTVKNRLGRDAAAG